MFHHFKNMFTRIKCHLTGVGYNIDNQYVKKMDKILKVRCDKSNIAMDMELF